MKHVLLTLSVVILCGFTLSAQKVGYIDTELILKEIPDYQTAQQQLNELADKYKAAIESEVGTIDALYRTYQSQKNNMTATQRAAKEEEIISKEKVVKEKQKIYFGEDGIMAKKSEELLTPIQNRITAAIEVLSSTDEYVMIIDLAVATGVVYKNAKYDLTQDVLKILKIK